MKKLLYLLVGVILILLVSSYLFIPNEIVVSKTEQIESSERIVSKFLRSPEQRSRWWPGNEDQSPAMINTHKYQTYSYSFSGNKMNSVDVTIGTGDSDLTSTISWLPYSGNIVRLTWKAVFPAGSNPVKRFSRYQQARKLKADMTVITENYLKFIVSHKNVYGHSFKVETVTDTLLATTHFKSALYPDNIQIYQAINKIRKYLERQGIQSTRPPMLNIASDGNGQYQTTVALPVPKRFQPDDVILLRNMVPGNILVANVRGGRKSVADGFSQMEMYIRDFKLSSPAIYFESLITNRSSEPDTSKWITKIYYPIY